MTSARSTGLRHYLPEPSRLWICSAPSSWPGASGLWVHLAERTLGSSGRSEVATLEVGDDADLTYLPPIEEGREDERQRLVDRLEASGVPVLTQRRPHQAEGRPEDVLDLLGILLDPEQGLDGLETSCRLAVWPLISGLTDSAERWGSEFDALVRAGVHTVVPMTLELTPADRRRLADFTDEAGYQALFHGPAPDERRWCTLAAERGLAISALRPDLAGTPNREFSRRVATELLSAADLWLRLGRSESAGQDLLRAARWVERSQRDLRALAREGNLGVLPWLGEVSREVVEALAADRQPELTSELKAEYLGTP